MGTWDTIWVILGSRGTPNGHTEVQMSIFLDFRMILGVSWDLLWAPFCDSSVIWDAKVGDSVQVHVLVIRDGNDARMQWLYVL